MAFQWLHQTPINSIVDLKAKEMYHIYYIIPSGWKMQLEGFASGREYGYKILLHNENHGKAGKTARIYIHYVFVCAYILHRACSKNHLKITLFFSFEKNQKAVSSVLSGSGFWLSKMWIRILPKLYFLPLRSVDSHQDWMQDHGH